MGSNRPVTGCIFSYSWSLDIYAFEHICKPKWCFRTTGLFTYTFSHRLVFLRFRTEGIVIIRYRIQYLNFELACDMWHDFVKLVYSHICFGVGLQIEIILSYKRLLPLYFFVKIFQCLYVSYIIFVISNGPVMRCMFSYS